MNFSELKNFDVGAYLKGVLNKNASLKGPQSKIILWSILGALIFILYIVFIFMPYLAERNQIEQKIAAIPEMEAKVKYLEIANRKAHEELVQTEINYMELNRLFSVESELEELYQRLSQMASSQGLVITALSTDGEEAVYAGGKTAAPGQPAPLPNGATPPAANPAPAAAHAAPTAPPLFYRIKLTVELSGNYSRFMRYRKLLASFEKSVNIDKEQIILVSGDTHGLVQVKSQLSTYRLPQKLQTNMIATDLKPLNKAFTPKTWMDHLKDSFAGWHFIRTAAAAGSPKKAKEPSVSNNEEVLSDNLPLDNTRLNERDPFSKSSSGMIEGGRDPRYSPLIMADPQSYVIMGVVVSNSVKAAMIRTDFRESYVVKVGDRLGNQGGIITDIDMDGIILRQPSGRIRLFLQSQAGQFPSNPDLSKSGGAR